MQYLPLLDGLRALAIILVLCNHANLSFFNFGYLGVDIFFVLSGYLITRTNLESIQKNKFEFSRFLTRRLLRLYPALLSVSFCCLIISYAVMPPHRLVEHYKSHIALSGCIQNFFFAARTDYFGLDASLNVLLHTWSLAVEEQFYVLFGLFSLLMSKLRLKFFKRSLIFVICSSLGLFLYYNYANYQFSFYSCFTRAWEIGCGCLLAFLFRKPYNGIKPIFVDTSFVILILSTTIIKLDGLFIGVNNIVVVLCTCFLIIFNNAKSLTRRILTNKLVTTIGLSSYSTYLIHQPLFAYLKTFSPLAFKSYIYITLISVLILGFLSYKWIECLFRNNTKFRIRHKFITLSVLYLLGLLISIYGINEKGFEKRVILGPIAKTTTRSRHIDILKNPITESGELRMVDLGAVNKKTSVLICGDSHAFSYLHVFDNLLRNNNIHGQLFCAGGFAPLLDVHSLRPNQNNKIKYFDINKKLFEYVLNQDIPNVIFIARWNFYITKDLKNRISYLSLSKDGDENVINTVKAFRYGLKNTKYNYEKNLIKIFFIEQVPHHSHDVKDILFLNKRFGISLKNFVMSEKQFNIQSRKVLEIFEDTGIELVKVNHRFLENGKYSMIDSQGSFYFDDDHLSLYGAELLYDDINKFIIQQLNPNNK